MMEITLKLVDLVKAQQNVITSDTTADEVIDMVMKVATGFATKPYTIEEVKMLQDACKDLSRCALDKKAYSFTEHGTVMDRIKQIFYAMNYREDRNDKALKGIHTLFDSRKDDAIADTVKEMKSEELCHAVEAITKIITALKSELVQATLQRAIHDAILGMSIGYGNTSRTVESDFANYLRVAELLGYYEPGTESQNAFITQCKVWTGVGEAGNYTNIPRVSKEDLELAKKYERTSMFGGE